MKYIKEIQCVSCSSIPPFSFAHLATDQRRSNEFCKESIYILVRSCYTIFIVDENGVVRARKKGVIHRETSRIRDTNLQHFPREKIK